jgi:DNA-binding transcriptional ArsR family regulator
MGNERRLMVLWRLAEREASVGELALRVGLSQSALSQHLAKLRQDGLVSTRRDRQTIYYALDGAEVAFLLISVRQLYGNETAASPSPDAVTTLVS